MREPHPNPRGPNKHAATVTRTALKGGGACYHLTVSAASEEVIQNGAHLEELTPEVWIASSINIRLLCLTKALVDLDANRAPETVN